MPDEKRLLKQLFTNYAQLGIVGRPVYNQSETVLVKFGIAVVKLLEMNNMDQTGTFSIWQRFVSIISNLYTLIYVSLRHSDTSGKELLICSHSIF